MQGTLVNEYRCTECKADNTRVNCTNCACHTCGGRFDTDFDPVCDECDHWFHGICLDPPMTQAPAGDEQWFCSGCYRDPNEVIKPGMAPRSEIKPSGNRKLGKCTVVGPNHRGAIPGIPVGHTWASRAECSEAGVHRPPMAGIAGNPAAGGAVSIVLSAGYPEDVDSGECFIYTGSGGKAPFAETKARLSVQTADQVLDRSNLALALACDAPVNNVDGAVAKDWKNSKAIRVVRGDKLKKHNKEFAPDTGYRYDGLYKVVRYWPDQGKSGFKVWRFKLQRDDAAPPPWAKTKQSNTASKVENPLRRTGRILKINGRLIGKMASAEQDDAELFNAEHTNSNGKRTHDFVSTSYKFRTWMVPLLFDFSDDPHCLYDEIQALCEIEYENEHEFIAFLQRNATCAICLDFLKAPVTFNCAHRCCVECIVKAVRISPAGAVCPICRTSLLDQPIEGDDKAQRKAWFTESKVDRKLSRFLGHFVPGENQHPDSEEQRCLGGVKGLKVQKSGEYDGDWL